MIRIRRRASRPCKIVKLSRVDHVRQREFLRRPPTKFVLRDPSFPSDRISFVLREHLLFQEEHIAAQVPASAEFHRDRSQRFVTAHQMKLADLTIRQQLLRTSQIVRDLFEERRATRLREQRRQRRLDLLPRGNLGRVTFVR